MSARSTLTRFAAAALLGGAVLGGVAGAQQRDPAYAAARSAGQVGEKMDGYLGFVTTPSAEVRRLVEDLNIKRKAVYAQQAQAQHATMEEYAFTAGSSHQRLSRPFAYLTGALAISSGVASSRQLIEMLT